MVIPSVLVVGLALGATVAVASPASPATAAPAVSAGSEPSSRPRPTTFAIQGGWWSVAAEWKTRSGVYLAAGLPWIAIPMAALNDSTWVVPIDARVGYQLPLSRRISLRASGHAAVAVDDEDIAKNCGCGSGSGVTSRTFLFAEVGVRYEASSGFVAGIDLPLYGLRYPHHPFPPPASLAFSQFYLGYAWGL